MNRRPTATPGTRLKLRLCLNYDVNALPLDVKREAAFAFLTIAAWSRTFGRIESGICDADITFKCIYGTNAYTLATPSSAVISES